MTTHIGARDARNNFEDLIEKVYYADETIIVEHSGKPMAAVIPIIPVREFLERLEPQDEDR